MHLSDTDIAAALATRELVIDPMPATYGSPGLGSHYQDSIGVVASKLGEDVK